MDSASLQISTDCCDGDVEFGLGPDTAVRCGANTDRCQHCNIDAGVCSDHFFECRARECTFRGCDDCVSEHEKSCGKRSIDELVRSGDWLGVARAITRTAAA